jgi:hypothetical protein
MRYIVAGYVVILTLLFLYAVQLIWRRRRLIRAVTRVASTDDDGPIRAPAIGRPS